MVHFWLMLQAQPSQQHAGIRGGTASGPSPTTRSRTVEPSAMHIQKILDENAGLIQTIQELQYVGKGPESMSYQVALHRNLVYLANLADPMQNIQTLLPVCVSPFA